MERAPRPSGNRSAATLVEVLVAIFVMAIGLTTLLVLFPLGLLSMAQAIKDDRCGHAAANAIAFEKMFAPFNLQGLRQGSPYWDATAGFFKDPTKNTTWPGDTSPSGLPVLPPTGFTSYPGYPVYLDPVGINLTYGASVGRMLGNTTVVPGIQRVDLDAASALRENSAWRNVWFGLLDDIEFDNNGLPTPGSQAPSGNSPIAREDRYTWAYMLHVGDISVPSPAVDLTIVVYSGRPQLSAETTYQANWHPGAGPGGGSNVVTLTWGTQQKPAIRKGGWILDATVVAPSAPTTPTPNGYFYRVVNVNDGASGPNTTDLELQTARRGPTMGSASDQGLGFVVVMDGVVEVFERAH